MRVLVDLAERALETGTVDPHRVQHFLGLQWHPVQGVHRPRKNKRTEDRRAMAWAYLGRCAFAESEFRQLGLPLPRRR